MLTRYALDGARADLSDGAEIIALMAQDLNDMRREQGGVTHDNLLDLGWTKRQLDSFFLRAIAQASGAYSDTKAQARAPHLTAQQRVYHAACEKFDAFMRRMLAEHEELTARGVRKAFFPAHAAANEVA